MKTVAEVIAEIDEVRNAIHKMEDVMEGDTVNSSTVVGIETLTEYAQKYIGELLAKGVK